MKTIKDCHDLYLKCTVFLLADVFLKKNGLYPSHYLSVPVLSWDTMLNITKVETELILDADLYLYFHKGMGTVIFNILKDIVTTTINIWNLMVKNKNENIFFTWI